MDEQEWLNIFGDNLRDILIEQQMTQRELADAAGLSESAVSYYLRKQRTPTLKALINMAQVLNQDLNTFIDFGERII